MGSETRGAAASELASPPALATGGLARAADWLIAATEVVVAALVVIEVVIVASGVIARYCFDSPLTWTDELATLFMPWLGMLGAVIALYRAQHMRLGFFVERVGLARRHWIDAFALLAVTLFAIALVGPAFQRYESQNPFTLTTLGVSDGLRVASVIVGLVLLAGVALFRLTNVARPRVMLGALAAAAGLIAALWLLKPLLLAMGNFNLFVYFVLLLSVFIVVGVPIAFATGIVTLLYLSTMTTVPLEVFVGRMDEGMSHLVLLSIPLFIFLGYLIEAAGFARALINFIASLIGHLRGGFYYVLMGAMFLVSGISGSKTADMAAIAPGLLPEMKRRGMNLGEMAALLSATAAMTETIPPSLVLIILGSVAGVSIGALFAGGLVPAVICTAAMAIVVYVRSRKDAPESGRAPRHVVGRTLLIAIPALILPVVIRTAVVEGVATATEVATVGVIYTLIVGPLIYGWIDLRRLYAILIATASLTGVVFIILGTATAAAWALTQSGFAQDLVRVMTNMPGGVVGFMLISIVGFIILGTMLEGLPAILLFSPLLFPASRALGVHDVHYAMVIIIAMGIGLFAPPFGTGFYAACAIANVAPESAMLRVLPYLGSLVIALLIIAAFPWLSTVFL